MNQEETAKYIRRLETAVLTMHQFYFLAMAYGEHGRPSEAAGLRVQGERERNNPTPGVIDTIIEVLEKGGR